MEIFDPGAKFFVRLVVAEGNNNLAGWRQNDNDDIKNDLCDQKFINDVRWTTTTTTSTTTADLSAMRKMLKTSFGKS